MQRIIIIDNTSAFCDYQEYDARKKGVYWVVYRTEKVLDWDLGSGLQVSGYRILRQDFLIEIFIKEIKPVVTKKIECEYRGISIKIASFGKFEQSGLRRKEKNHPLFDGVLWYNYKVSDWELTQICEPCIFW